MTKIPASQFRQLIGASIIAADGTFLGYISTDRLSQESIRNRLGPYGSRLSATSILNKLGPYGGRLSALSPFNRLSSDPPKIVLKQNFVGYLTVNRLMSPQIDTHELIGWLEIDYK